MSKTGVLFRCLAAAVVLVASPAARAQEPVDVALVLAVDVSLSMSYEELRIQREGYAAAIASPDVVAAIHRGAYRRIAVTMFEWAGDTHQRSILDWMIIEDQAGADRVSAQLLATPSQGRRRTSISGAIEHGVSLLDTMPFPAERLVIDISGDGPNNQGLPVTEARDTAIAKGYVINGLPLMTTGGPGGAYNIADLDQYYSRCVVGGPGGFMVPVSDWDQFPEAIRRKLVMEIGDLSEPVARVIPVQFDSEPYDCLIGEKIWQQRGWTFDEFDR